MAAPAIVPNHSRPPRAGVDPAQSGRRRGERRAAGRQAAGRRASGGGRGRTTAHDDRNDALSTQGANGPDRIAKSVYDAAGQVLQTLQALGTSVQRTYATNVWGQDGEQLSVTDANGNTTCSVFDGFLRLSQLRFPSTTLGAGTCNTADYEAYSYDPGGNRLTLRKRDGVNTIAFTYDALDRQIVKDIPPSGSSATDVYTDYDYAGRPTHARFASRTGSGIDYAYDTAGRLTSETTFSRTLGYQYDLAGNRTRVTWPDGF